MRIQNQQLNFKGIQVNKAKVLLPEKEPIVFDIYKATEKDFGFMKAFSENIKIKELFPGLEEYDYVFWDKFIKKALTSNIWNKCEHLLIARDNKMCGALKYSEKPGMFFIDTRATWPIKKGEKEPCAGKILTLTLFLEFLKTNAKQIKTLVFQQGPFDTFAKCLKLGFTPRGGDDFNEVMSINRGKIAEILEKYKSIIKFEPPESSEDIDLASKLQ